MAKTLDTWLMNRNDKSFFRLKSFKKCMIQLQYNEEMSDFRG